MGGTCRKPRPLAGAKAVLAQRGRGGESPTLLIAAAELLSGVSVSEAKDREKKTRENEGAGEAGEKADAEAPALTAVELLADARQLAGDDEALGQLIARLERAQQGAMGRVPGPGSTVTRVNAFSTDIFTENAGVCRKMPRWSQARLLTLVRL